MINDEQAVLDEVNADKWAMLYRCRWSQPDADRVVPQLTELLDSTNPLITHESLRALFRIGTPAARAAPRVAELTESDDSMTRRLAVLALGQIAHTIPDACVGPLASALSDAECCRDALRALAFIGSEAHNALDQVKPLFSNPDAKVRKAAVMAASAINAADTEIIELLHRAVADRSKIVREAASKCLQATRIG
ncbi:HEAT repeat protein [Stieleria bergensis]|uniref:HEAT repeat protein n=1 Tax=Stieleria bergensis TaxID=2528025 RepID=A0A517SPD1_9BACT|nr:HEAT repeat protein [Planctomycetes bacterium SV_7m_r]